MQVRRLSDIVGVEIEGPDLSRPRDPEEDREIGRLFNAHGLVAFRDQKLTKQQLHNAGAAFGGAMTDIPGAARDPDVPGIVVVSTRGAGGDFVPADGDKLVGDIEWHTDHGYVTTPPRGKILYAVQVPLEGGLTGFIDGQLTYDALSEDMKRRIENLHVVHSFKHAEATIARQRAYHRDADSALAPDRYPDVAFPVTYRHPVTGARVLNAPPLWASSIVEMPGAEGKALVEDLKQHITQPKFQYWHRYRVGDAVLWDNWRFIHAAGGTPGRHARTLWSIAIKGGGVELGSSLSRLN